MLGFPTFATKVVYSLDTMENAVQSWPSWKFKSFSQVITNRHRKQSFFVCQGCTACKQTW